MSSVFVDANIPMYLVGAPHPNKTRAQRLLEELVTTAERLVTDAETMQEILHRYSAIGRPDAIEPATRALLALCDEVFPVEQADVERAALLLVGTAGLSARDALHAAIMRRRGVTRLLSFDRGFDRLAWVERLS